MKKEAKIISSKGAISPFAKMIEKEGIAVEETVFVGSPEQFLDALTWDEKQEKELQDLLNETRRRDIFKDVED